MHIIDQTILFSYFFINVLIGLYFAFGKKQTPDEFISARNSMPGWALGCSIVATYFSSIGFLAFTGKAYDTDWAIFAYALTILLPLYLAIKYFIPFHRKNKDVSSFSCLSRRFGPWATNYAIIFHSITLIIRMGVMLFLVSKTIAFATGYSELHIILIVGIITTIYTCSGGLKSVIWTDVIQFAIMIVGTFLIFGYLIYNTQDGLSGFFSIAVDNNKFNLGDFSPSLIKKTFWTLLISDSIMNIYVFGISPAYIQRYLAASSEKEAKSTMLWSTLCYCLLVFIFLAIGTALFTFFQTNPSLLPSDINGGDAAYTYFIGNILPIGMRGLMISAILAAAMSSIDSTVNSLSMLYLVNIHQQYINPNPGRRTSMNILYTCSAFLGGLAIVIATLFRNQESMLDTWMTLLSLFMGGTLGIFILGLISKKAKSPAAIIGLIAGTLIIAWSFATQYLPEKYVFPLNVLMTYTVANCVIVLVGLLITLFKRQTN